jgi:hypothetical protein
MSEKKKKKKIAKEKWNGQRIGKAYSQNRKPETPVFVISNVIDSISHPSDFLKIWQR